MIDAEAIRQCPCDVPTSFVSFLFVFVVVVVAVAIAVALCHLYRHSTVCSRTRRIN